MTIDPKDNGPDRKANDHAAPEPPPLDSQQSAVRYKAFRYLFSQADLQGIVDEKKLHKKLKESRNLEKSYHEYLEELEKNPRKKMVFPWESPFRRFLFWLGIWIPRSLKWGSITFVTLFILNYFPGPTQHFIEVMIAHTLYDTAMLDRLPDSLESYAHSANIVGTSGEIIKSYGKRTVTARIPDRVRNALLACEDHFLLPHENNPWYVNMFMVHAGVSWPNIIGATIDTLRGRKRGASTIIMQNAKKVLGNTDRTLANKLKEMITAYKLVSIFGKEKNLDFYLNTVPVGQNIYGFPAAAENYFRKNLDSLTIQQLLTIASFIPNHNRQIALYSISTGSSFAELDPGMRKHAQDSLSKVNLALAYMLKREEISPAEYQEWYLDDEESIRRIGLRPFNSPLYGEEGWTSWNVIRDICSREYLLNGNRVTGPQLLLDVAGDVEIETKVDLALAGTIKETITDFLTSRSYRQILEKRNRNIWLKDLKSYQDRNTNPPYSNFTGFMENLFRHLNVGVMIIDHEGDVIAHIGGKEFSLGKNTQDKGDGGNILIDLMDKNAKITPSSTIKPIIAYYAMVNNNANLSTLFADKPIEYKYVESEGRKIWLPRNSYGYDAEGTGRNRYLGRKYTLLDAQVLSINTIFARLYSNRALRSSMLVGLDKAGLDYNQDDARFWPFGIGASEVPVQQWLGIYGAFLDGYYREPSLVRRIRVNGNVIYDRAEDPEKKPVLLFDAKQERDDTMKALYEICNRGTGASMNHEFRFHRDLVSGKTGTSPTGRSSLFVSHFNPYRNRLDHQDKNLTMIVSFTTNTGGHKSVGTSTQGPVKIAGRIYDHLFRQELSSVMDAQIEKAKKNDPQFRKNHLYWANVNRYLEKMMESRKGDRAIHECLVGVDSYSEALEQILSGSNRIYTGREDLFDQLITYYCDQEKIVRISDESDN
ncbi:MAG: transglycosylase domain-containing protein [Proteobacteria bacterium]|nr:transglycosylase domain-containing protein [Pseudomonadota bacterium]MBU1738438.1 transglycosylase domain-containing protein [Pseudomonadota bacterium]